MTIAIVRSAFAQPSELRGVDKRKAVMSDCLGAGKNRFVCEWISEEMTSMSVWPPCPTLYEINTWVWLSELSLKLGASADLNSVPSAEWGDSQARRQQRAGVLFQPSTTGARGNRSHSIQPVVCEPHGRTQNRMSGGSSGRDSSSRAPSTFRRKRTAQFRLRFSKDCLYYSCEPFRLTSGSSKLQ
jgi:hypothetical protein